MIKTSFTTSRITCVPARCILIFYTCLCMSVLCSAGETDTLFVTVLDVGQGLAVYCECDGHAMLYDGGGRDTASNLVSFLREKGVQRLDYAVVSHYDDDHLAGVIGALHVFDCGLILAPDYIGQTTIYTSFRELLDQIHIPWEAPAVGNVYPLGAASVETIGPDGFAAEWENDRCTAIRICLGNTAVILCGDAQEEEETQIAAGWMRADADVYVVNHHGSSSSSTDRFLDAVSPLYAVISCGEGNDHGHPSAAAMRRLDAHGARIYRTDVQGDIAFSMDGENVVFEKEPTADRTPGSAAGENGFEEKIKEIPALTYVCNFKTFIFHRPECETVSRMSEKNKVYSEQSRQELIGLGYRPCGICDP